MSQIKLFSARACPFAHRTRLVLSHKKLPFELVEVDLQNKPAWFDAKLSGYGKVPALEHNGQHLWESAVVNEYLEEVFPEPRLLPVDAVERARARIWIDYANTRFVGAFGKLLRLREDGDEAAARRELTESLSFIERGLAADGPFFLGAEPSLVDLAFYPWFERWPALEQLRSFPLPRELERLHRWVAAVRELPAVREHANAPDYYVQRYRSTIAPRKAVA
ncbi:MAG TPA: glutathione S-transferase family protein [Polyangiales bacterium]|nr:glutathione S-transferase family protein [Polyangiales bacterium]